MNDAVAVQPIPLRRVAPWLALVPLFLMVLYLLGLDQGAISHAGSYLHELMHDGRHLLALPCH
ncbi:MAG: hypothetical protein QOK40_3440 [Miltoncostaeaceae bacterium]|jgi:hypothetical protein|nr:hypothetical protein [Miltoncostaeaceae bacterium]